jgi:hypothetical protein
MADKLNGTTLPRQCNLHNGLSKEAGRQEAEASSSHESTRDKNQTLIRSLVVAEYHYAESQALQFLRDRLRVLQFYFSFVGFVLTYFVVFRDRLLGADTVSIAMRSGPLILLIMLGLVSVLLLLRYRTAWFDCLTNMNYIKSRAAKSAPGYEQFFLWTGLSFLARGEFGSVTFGCVLIITVIDSVAAGLTLIVSDSLVCQFALNGVVLVSIVTHLLMYFVPLSLRKKRLRKRYAMMMSG